MQNESLPLSINCNNLRVHHVVNRNRFSKKLALCPRNSGEALFLVCHWPHFWMQSSSQYTLSQNLTNQKIIHQDNTSNVSPTLPQPVNTCQTRIIQINRTISVPINSTKRPLPPIPSLKSPPVKLQSPVTKGPPPSISNSSVPKIRQHAATHVFWFFLSSCNFLN